jgi:hypothetical protein
LKKRPQNAVLLWSPVLSATWDHWIIDEQTQYYMIVHYHYY